VVEIEPLRGVVLLHRLASLFELFDQFLTILHVVGGLPRHMLVRVVRWCPLHQVLRFLPTYTLSHDGLDLVLIIVAQPR